VSGVPTLFSPLDFLVREGGVGDTPQARRPAVFRDFRKVAGGAAKESPDGRPTEFCFGAVRIASSRREGDSPAAGLMACPDRSDMNAECPNAPAATLLVCITCKSEERPLGAGLFAALSDRLAGETDIALKPIECLSVCKRPCTVALAAPGKWTYVVGDLTREEHIEDIVTAARRYGAAPHGIVPWRERPLSFRKGVVSRTPPLAAAQVSLS
jgi:predicted metal-binding protein